jgi:endonuclease/exonuclease/phosphatase family metal-dependent hydrolase
VDGDVVLENADHCSHHDEVCLMPTIVPLSRRRPSLVAAAAVAAVTTLGLLSAVPAAATSRPAAPTSLAVHSAAGHYLTWSEGTAGVGFVIQQARNSGFSTGVVTYRLRGPGRTFTPYRVSLGGTYYFRVRAVVGSLASGWSNRVSYTVANGSSAIRVVSYNSMSASADGQQHPGGVAAPFSQRRSGQLSLLMGSGADVIGFQEAGSCLHAIQGQPCYRQVDSLVDGLRSKYSLADTMTTEKRSRYAANYVLYDANVAPVGSGGTWYIGDTSSEGLNAAYQLFRVVSTGARFLFVTTHLGNGTTYAGDQSRARQTQRILDNARSYAGARGVSSIVYVGDFNTYVGEWHVSDLSGNKMRSAHVPDGIEVAQSRPRAQFDSINALFRTARKGHGSIDHIYASGGVGVRTWGELLNISSGKFVGTIPSDHNPVWAALTIPY